MKIGIPKEVKDHEYRIGATPNMVKALTKLGHDVYVQRGGGEKIGFSNQEYERSGARIVGHAREVYAVEMVIKVKEPQREEFPFLKRDQILFCYLHLAPDPTQAAHCSERKWSALLLKRWSIVRTVAPFDTHE